MLSSIASDKVPILILELTLKSLATTRKPNARNAAAVDFTLHRVAHERLTPPSAPVNAANSVAGGEVGSVNNKRTNSEGFRSRVAT